jgi:predicted hydrocarbon binding protein
MKGAEKNVGELIKTYIELLEQLGFGRIELVEFNEKHAVIKMLEPPSMTGLQFVGGKAMNHFRGGNKMCHIEAGMLASVFEKILGKRYRAYEIGHGTLENPYCTIRVEEQG